MFKEVKERMTTVTHKISNQKSFYKDIFIYLFVKIQTLLKKKKMQFLDLKVQLF